MSARDHLAVRAGTTTRRATTRRAGTRRATTRRAGTVLPLVAALVLASCGGTDGGIAEEAAGPLGLRVAAVRATAGEDPARALVELDALRADVDRLVAEGALDAGAAARIDEAADGVAALLTASTTTTAPPAPAPTPAPADDDDDDGKGGDEDDEDRKGKGKGGEKDDD